MTTPAPAPTTDRIRLEFLDGLRGLAALYVVLFHSTLHFKDDYALPPVLRFLTGWMGYGHFAVGFFIVLSGYCLMLPVARTPDGSLRGGVGDYLKRRARRILPPYYIALFFSWLLVLISLKTPFGGGDKTALAFNVAWPVVISHLLMFYNVRPDWATAINSPMWSVATEWQIYFIFPALLLPVWRKFGSLAAVLVGFAVGLAPHFLLPPAYNMDSACFWYIGLFALGMMGAAFGFGTRSEERRWESRLPWGALATACFFALCALAALRPDWMTEPYYWAIDILIGALALCLIVYCTRASRHAAPEDRPILLRVLESPGATLLGAFSYSLYLTHRPLQFKIFYLFQRLHLSSSAAFVAMLAVGVPLLIFLAYLFYLAFERRFVPGARKKTAEERR